MPEEEQREKLAKVISQWNSSRLDLFEISQPDEVSRLDTRTPLFTPDVDMTRAPRVFSLFFPTEPGVSRRDALLLGGRRWRKRGHEMPACLQQLLNHPGHPDALGEVQA